MPASTIPYNNPARAYTKEKGTYWYPTQWKYDVLWSDRIYWPNAIPVTSNSYTNSYLSTGEYYHIGQWITGSEIELKAFFDPGLAGKQIEWILRRIPYSQDQIDLAKWGLNSTDLVTTVDANGQSSLLLKPPVGGGGDLAVDAKWKEAGSDATLHDIYIKAADPIVFSGPTKVEEGTNFKITGKVSDIFIGSPYQRTLPEIYYKISGTATPDKDFTIDGYGPSKNGNFYFYHSGSVKPTYRDNQFFFDLYGRAFDDLEYDQAETIKIEFFKDYTFATSYGKYELEIFSKPPTYLVSASRASCIEGDNVVVSISTQRVIPNTPLWWSLSGKGIEQKDFIGLSSLSGNLLVDSNGLARLSLDINKDGLAEGPEVLQVKIFSDSAKSQQVGETVSVQVNDPAPIAVKDTTVWQNRPFLHGNSFYQLVQGPTWREAEAQSVNLGGHLAAVNDKGEDDFLFSTYVKGSGVQGGLNNQLWIGLTDERNERQYEWSNGDPFTYNNINPQNYPKPGTGESAVENAQDWVLYWYPDGTWDTQEIGGSLGGRNGIAEVPLSLNFYRTGLAREGSGLFTTSIYLSAGSTATGNLAKGQLVYWKVTGITIDDLDSGTLTGSGLIRDGRLDLQHALKTDSDKDEVFNLVVYSDSSLSMQIGNSFAFSIEEAAQSVVEPPILTSSGVVSQPSYSQDIFGNISTYSPSSYLPTITPKTSWSTFALTKTSSASDLVSQWFVPSANSAQTAAISDTKFLSVLSSSWSDTVKLNSIAQAAISGSKLEAPQVDFTADARQGSVINGSSGADELWGKAGWDILDGAAGNDLIRAGNGRDIITGGLGADELHGDFGWNTYKSEKDGFRDLIAIKSDQFLSNWLYGKAGNNPSGEKADVIEGLDSNDQIKIIGVYTADLTFQAGASSHGVSGIGIYANGALEAVYIGGELSVGQIATMTTGDASAAAMNNQISSYGWTG